jgi:hypothetical protein
MMNTYPRGAAARHARIAVAFQCFATSLFPFTNIRSRSTPAPMMAFLASMRPGDGFAATPQAAVFFLIPACRPEHRATDRAGPVFSATAIPTSDSITGERAVNRWPIFDLCSRSIESIIANCATAFLAVFMPIEWLRGHTLVPRHAVKIAVSTFSRAINAITEGARNCLTAASAWMGFWSHEPSLAQYADMAKRRIEGDAPLFADVTHA